MPVAKNLVAAVDLLTACCTVTKNLLIVLGIGRIKYCTTLCKAVLEQVTSLVSPKLQVILVDSQLGNLGRKLLIPLR